jgi:hypothetical protein
VNGDVHLSPNLCYRPAKVAHRPSARKRARFDTSQVPTFSLNPYHIDQITLGEANGHARENAREIFTRRMLTPKP